MYPSSTTLSDVYNGVLCNDIEILSGDTLEIGMDFAGNFSSGSSYFILRNSKNQTIERINSPSKGYGSYPVTKIYESLPEDKYNIYFYSTSSDGTVYGFYARVY